MSCIAFWNIRLFVLVFENKISNFDMMVYKSLKRHKTHNVINVANVVMRLLRCRIKDV